MKDNKVDLLVTPTEPKGPSEGKQDVAKNKDTSANHKQSQEMNKALVFFRKVRRKAWIQKENNDCENTIVDFARKPKFPPSFSC